MDLSHTHTSPAEKKRWYRQSYFYVCRRCALRMAARIVRRRETAP